MFSSHHTTKPQRTDLFRQFCDLQEECLAATSSSIDKIQQLHDSIPMPHAPVLSHVSPQELTWPSTGSAPGSAPAPGLGALDNALAPAVGLQIEDPSTDLSDSASMQLDSNPVAVVGPASRSPSSPVAPIVAGSAAGVVLTLLSVLVGVMLARRRDQAGTCRTYDIAAGHNVLPNVSDQAATHMHE